MEKDKKEGSFVNQDLNCAFVEGQLNKTVTANSNENSNWNLLDDPQMEMLKDQGQEDIYDQNFLDITEKELKASQQQKIGGMESSIHFKNKAMMVSNLGPPKKSVDDDEDQDLKDMLSEVFKGKNAQK